MAGGTLGGVKYRKIDGYGWGMEHEAAVLHNGPMSERERTWGKFGTEAGVVRVSNDDDGGT